MSRKAKSFYNDAIQTLLQLKEDHPTHALGQHLEIALAEYGSIWGMTDKELSFALEKYAVELNSNTVPDEDLTKIIEEGSNLDTILDEEQEEEDY